MAVAVPRAGSLASDGVLLVGREDERALVDELLERGRRGNSDALLVRGEAGIGKTALLEYAVEQADGMTVVRALGVERGSLCTYADILLPLCQSDCSSS